MKFNRALWIIIGVPGVLLVSAFAFIKPLRIVAPALMPGIKCLSADFCTDNVASLGKARMLYSEGYEKVVAAVGPFHKMPRVVFCTTSACAGTFGAGRRAAQTVFDFGVVVAPRGWKSFYLAHELIHYRQAESLGYIAMIAKPRWLIEGMAYSLSDDPRHPLSQPIEHWRTQFDTWHAGIGSRDLWEAAQAVY